MRNLLEYPVTRDEVLECLTRLRADLNPELIGDMTPVLLDHAIAIVKTAFDLRDGFDRRGKEPGMGFVVPFPEATALIKAVDFKGKP
jgi:hypothetical protein